MPVKPKAKPMLGSIVCTPASAAVGEAVKVEVRAPDGSAYDNQEQLPITINGVPGSSQYLVWGRPGAKRLVVLARTHAGGTERLDGSVTITKAADDAALPPLLRVTWSLEHAGRATFRVVRPHTIPSRATTPIKTVSQTKAVVVTEIPKAAVAEPEAYVTHVDLSASFNPGVATAKGGTSAPAYTWAIGSGRAIASPCGYITHDFITELDPSRPYTVFDVAVTVSDPGQKPVTVQRTVAVWNPYHMMKRRGVLQPPVVSSTARARFKRHAWHASFEVYNPESFALVLTGQRIQLVSEDDSTASTRVTTPAAHAIAPKPVAHVERLAAPPGGTSSQTSQPGVTPGHAVAVVLGDDWLAAETVNIVLKPKVSTTIEVKVPAASVGQDVIALRAHLSGTGHGGKEVRVQAAFDIPEHMSDTEPASKTIGAVLDKVVAQGLFSPGDPVTLGDLKTLSDSGAIDAGLVAQMTAPPPTETLMDVHVEPDNAVEGEECFPDNLPEVVPDGLYCMPTEETNWVKVSARFMNASKGDIILSPGDGGLIGDTLAAVDPSQPYSHSGIMTRNLDEVTHSTASIERLTDSDFLDLEGFRWDVLKFLWPGAITQTVKHSVDGESLVDPETGKSYTVSGFGSLQVADWTGKTAVAMVVKPKPETETDATRLLLEQIADNAIALSGKCHYRFFCYTDPSIGIDQPAPNDAKWAAGTMPTVCASMIWLAIRQSVTTIEGTLEAEDMDAGAQIATSTKDGLYLYTADERLNAGEVLYSQIVEMVMNSASGVLPTVLTQLTDYANELANQILNAFASDWADQDACDSDKWKQASDASAVSPQNLMFYDSPLYGYSEPLIYRGDRWELVTTYKWKKVTKTGTITGKVKWDGSGESGVDVQITSSQVTHTDSSGNYTLTDVPEGDVILYAQKEKDGVLLTGQVSVTVTGNATTTANITLAAPSEVFRRILITGTLITRDYEFAAAGDPYASEEFNGIIDLDPSDATHDSKTFTCLCDGDTLGWLKLTVDLNSDNSVSVTAKIRCYDSDKADTDDYDEATYGPFSIGAGETTSRWTEVDGENYAYAIYSITNETNPS
jgi:hypothetical protein